MKIGITTPSYNQGKYIEKTIFSVLAQTRQVDYYSIHDSCSDDGTFDILQKYRNEANIFITVAKDKGQADAINSAFTNMPEDIEIMAYLNADDLLAPDAIETVMRVFESRPEVNFITGWRQIVGPKGNVGMICKSFPRSYEEMLISTGINQEATFWRRSLYKRAGQHVNASYRFAMDYELWIRMCEAKWMPLYLNQVLGYFRVHPESKTSTSFREIGFTELNRIRIQRGLQALDHASYKRNLYRIRTRELGRLGFMWWRLRYHLERKLLIKHYL